MGFDIVVINIYDMLFSTQNIRFQTTYITQVFFEKGAIKISDTVFNYSKSYKSKTLDLNKLIDWATNKKLSDDEIENLVALCGNTFVPKLRGLDAVAEKKGMDKQLARDTFIEKIWDEEPKLQVIKTSNDTAPVWAKDLKEMERRK